MHVEENLGIARTFSLLLFFIIITIIYSTDVHQLYNIKVYQGITRKLKCFSFNHVLGFYNSKVIKLGLDPFGIIFL